MAGHFQPLSVRITGDTGCMARKGRWRQTRFEWEGSRLSLILRSLFRGKVKSAILVSWKQRIVFLPVWERREASVFPLWLLDGCGDDLLHLCLIYTQRLWNSARVTIWFLTVTLMEAVLSRLLQPPCPGFSQSLLFQDDGGHSAPGHCLNVMLSELRR